MGSFFFAFGWGIFILLSLTGWGSVLNWLLFPNDRTDWGQRAAWGVALSVVVGGVLNLLSSISRTTILFYLGLGIAFWVIDLLVRRPRPPESISHPASNLRSRKAYLIICGVLVILLALIQYAGSISVARSDYPSSFAGPVRFNQADDFQAYFIFPEKMLQLGSMGRDPFCSRRLESALGGQAFLDTFVLSVLSVQHLHIVDPGIGLLLILGLLWGNFKERGTSLCWSLAILLVFVWIDPPTVNVASLYIGTAMFLSLCRTLAWKALPASRFLSRAIIIALIATAICSLKSNFIPACGVMLVCSYLCYVASQHFSREAIAELVGTAVLTVAFTLPWMISMHQSSGTFLYPLLGRGFHQSAYKDSMCPYCWLTASTVLKLLVKHLTDVFSVAVGTLGVFYLASRRREIKGREAILSLLLGAAFGHVVVTLAAAESFSRYSYPFLLAATLILITEAASPPEEPGQGNWQASGPIVAVAVLLFLTGSTWDASKTLYAECLDSAREGLRHKSLVSKQDVEAYETLQQSVPPGEALLEKLDKPFLLDFKRNTVLVLDWAAASPPPGMPYSRGSEALARYLSSQSIRYVAYSYGGEAERRKLPTYFPWFRIQLLYSYDFEDNMEGLGKTRRHLYDDGNSFVLDLLQPGADSVGLNGKSGSSTN
jgi:hypothetical protein